MMLFIWIMFQGCYDLHHPLYLCGTCQRQWTLNVSALYKLDLLSSFQELNIISPVFQKGLCNVNGALHKRGGRVSIFVLHHIKKLYFSRQHPKMYNSLYLVVWTYQDTLQCSFLTLGLRKPNSAVLNSPVQPASLKCCLFLLMDICIALAKVEGALFSVFLLIN